MTRVYVVTEGQTEEAFVRELLIPIFAPRGLFLTPIIISTSPGYKGGVVSFAKVRPQLTRLCKQDKDAYVTTLFDLYALPSDFPGKTDSAYRLLNLGEQKAHYLEASLARDIDERNFIPNLLVHEYEALLFSEPTKFAEWVDDTKITESLTAIAEAFDGPEHINCGPLTAPSKRILGKMPAYQKTFHGPLIACSIGLEKLRDRCPHFHSWLRKLEDL